MGTYDDTEDTEDFTNYYQMKLWRQLSLMFTTMPYGGMCHFKRIRSEDDPDVLLEKVADNLFRLNAQLKRVVEHETGVQERLSVLENRNRVLRDMFREFTKE